jgi:hypothetical protein
VQQASWDFDLYEAPKSERPVSGLPPLAGPVAAASIADALHTGAAPITADQRKLPGPKRSVHKVEDVT